MPLQACEALHVLGLAGFDPATYQLSNMGESLNDSFLICEKGLSPGPWVRILEGKSLCGPLSAGTWYTVDAQQLPF